MAGIKDDNFFVVYKWMLNRLHLKGVALQIFAIIYGFGRNGTGSFSGSLKYLMNFTNSSKNTVLKALKELVEKRYIVKAESVVNGVRVCTYTANFPLVQKLNQGCAKTEPRSCAKIALEGCADTEPNNINANNIFSIHKEKVQGVVALYHQICISYPQVKVMSDRRVRKILAMLDTYSLEDMETVFRNAESSSFMKGINRRGWHANFDWMLDADNFVKILEGNYADKAMRKVPGCTEPTLGEAELEAIQRVLQKDVPTEDWTCES